MRVRKNIIVALAAAGLLSLYLACAPAFAEDMTYSSRDGLCVHHPEHTAECGYYLQTGEETCTHIHDDSCGYVDPVEGRPCTHIHDETCGYVEAKAEIPCDKGCMNLDGDGVIDHVEGCAYQPAVEGSPCTHVHDETCGFAAPTEGSPCTHVHNEICGYVDPAETGACVFAEEGCPYCVVDWQWSDAQEYLTQESDGSWSLYLPGVSASHFITAEALASLLPGQLTAQMDNGTSANLPIAWDFSALPAAGATGGDYVLSASLEAPYALTEAAAPLQVTLRLGGAEIYDSTLPSGTPPFDEHIVQGVSPNGTTINFFDYWLEGQTSRDTYNPDKYYDLGINANHALLFTYQMQQPAHQKPQNNDPVGNWNGWTRGKSPYTGMVQNTLQNGYPALNLGETIADGPDTAYVAGRNGLESLAYLFDPDIQHEGKASYENVRGLLQVDDQGYYYYDSQQNYAVYYEETNSFVLYGRPGVAIGNTQSEDGQFFPFNEATEDPDENEKGLMRTNLSNASSMNHYFGLHMSTRFVQQYGGYVDEGQITPVTYEFSGDDDVWIFIDGKLAVDLGGLHNRACVTINFATGDVYVNDFNGNGEKDNDENGFEHYFLGNKLGYTSTTLPNNTYHTLDFFYLERGNTDSNLKLRYNLVTIPESSVIKVDQVGEPVPGAKFGLYAVDDPDTAIATGTTNHNGEFVFVKEETYGKRAITIQELYKYCKDKEPDKNVNSLILREISVPEGYRSNGDIGLYFYQSPYQEDEVLLLSNSVWDKGAYAMAKLTATLPTTLHLIENNSAAFPSGADAEGLFTPLYTEHPLMFAVVYQKQSDGSTWLPVSGDPLNGWTVQKDSTWESVLAAAQDNPYIFQLASSGAYQVEVSNLPGDIKTYYFICQDNAQYAVAYYYTSADTLSKATASNTWRISSQDASYPINRIFSVNLYVSNIKNRLFVQKVDDEGTPVREASFALYQKSDIEVDPADRTFRIKENAKAYDTVETGYLDKIGIDGGGVFPTGNKVLAEGEYYLVETAVPSGYKISEQAIHIVVDDTGVYADAGDENDGVVVLRGVGSIIHSMVQFAVDDAVDTTLHDIKATLASNVTYEDGGISWDQNGIDWDAGDNQVIHLQFKKENATLDYGPTNENQPKTLVTDVGWSKLLVRQCSEHKGTKSGVKQELGTQDITNLFSGTVIVRVTNERVGNLKITKTVTAEPGQTAPVDVEFTFTLHNQKGGTPVSGTFDTVKQEAGAATSVESTITFVDGITSLTLKGGESLTILGLPCGSYYSIEEKAVPGYNVSSTTNGIENDTGITTSGNIPHSTTEADNDAEVVAFTNHYDGQTRIVLTGVKKLLGRDFKDSDQFIFTLKAADDDDDTQQAINDGKIIFPDVTDEPKEIIAVVTNVHGTKEADFSFAPITFKQITEPVTYKFVIQEQIPEGASGNVYNGVQYDTHTIIATVTVSYDEDVNGWAASATYSIQEASSEDQTSTDKATFTNTGAYDLTIEKKVTGEMGDRDKQFTFQIELKKSDDNALTGEYDYTGGIMAEMTDVTAPQDGTLILDEKGAATFKLSHGQTITIHGLPVGTTYSITEPDAQADGYRVTPTGDVTSYLDGHCEGTLKKDTTVTFTNEKDTAVPTGIRLDALPWLLALLCGLGGCTALCVTGRTRKRKGGCGRTHG